MLSGASVAEIAFMLLKMVEQPVDSINLQNQLYEFCGPSMVEEITAIMRRRKKLVAAFKVHY